MSASRTCVTSAAATPDETSTATPSRLHLGQQRARPAPSRASSSGAGHERTKSNASGATRKPTVDITPAPNGAISVGAPSARATRKPCTGPAPPNTNTGRPRGSWPRSSTCTRAAFAIDSLTLWWMPQAASSTRQAERRRHALGDRPPRAVEVERHPAAEEVAGIEVAEHEVGVGDGRLGAAAAVADRAGIGAGRVGPDAQQAERVDARDRAAAGADLDHLDHADLDRQARALLEAVAAVDLELARGQRLAVDDHGELGGRAADVEREQVGDAGRGAVVRGGERARRGARLEQPHREAHRRLGRGDAAGRQHQPEDAGEADPRQPLPAARAGTPRCGPARRRSRSWSRCARTRAAPAPPRTRSRCASPARRAARRRARPRSSAGLA